MTTTDEELLGLIEENNAREYIDRIPHHKIAAKLVFPGKFSKHGAIAIQRAIYSKAYVFDRTPKNGGYAKTLAPLKDLRSFVNGAEYLRDLCAKFLANNKITMDLKTIPEELILLPFATYLDQLWNLSVMEKRKLRDTEFEKKCLIYLDFVKENYPKIEGFKRKRLFVKLCNFEVGSIFYVGHPNSEETLGLIDSKTIDLALIPLINLSMDLKEDLLAKVNETNSLSFFRFLPKLRGTLDSKGALRPKNRMNITPILVNLGILIKAKDDKISDLGVETLSTIYGMEG